MGDSTRLLPDQKGGLNRLKELRERVHPALHRNLRLLGLRTPMSPDLIECLSEGMLRKPNTKALNHAAHYLMTIIDEEGKYATADLELHLKEPKLWSHFRRQFCGFVADVSKKHEGRVSPMNPSWLITGGGHHPALLLLELSQIALDQDAKSIRKTVPTRDGPLADKTARLINYNSRMRKISDLYNNQIAAVQTEIEDKMKTLKNFARSVGDKSGELADPETPSGLLARWNLFIEVELLKLEEEWSRSHDKLSDISRRCKNSSEELIQKYTRTASEVPFAAEERPVDFPGLFESFSTTLAQDASSITQFKMDSKYCTEVEKRLESFKNLQWEANQLVMNISDLNAKLEESQDKNSSLGEIRDEDRWIADILDLPSFS